MITKLTLSGYIVLGKQIVIQTLTLLTCFLFLLLLRLPCCSLLGLLSLAGTDVIRHHGAAS